MVILPVAGLTYDNFGELPANFTENFYNMLNRDQRTTLTIDREQKKNRVNILSSWRRRTSRKSHEKVFQIANSETAISEFRKNAGSRNWDFWKRKQSSFQKLFFRLSKVFIVGVSLLTLVRIPTVTSTPYKRHSKSRAIEEPPSYILPCGKIQVDEMGTQHLTSQESDGEILKHIILRTQSALSYTESFRDAYVQKTFHLSFEEHHSHWASHKYNWLPNDSNEIPKELGKHVDYDHLKGKTFDGFLINIYKQLQKFAVALEQVVWDQKNFKGEFKDQFYMTEVHLRNVLCEIRIAMLERNIIPQENVLRSSMTEDFRKLTSESYRNLRDWFIFRDYMNTLEYIIQVCTYIEENLPGSAS